MSRKSDAPLPSPSPPFDERGLNATELLATRAWQASLVQKAPQPSHSWNAPGRHDPLYLHNQDEAGAAPTNSEEEPSAADEARYLIGSVALGLVIVSRDEGLVGQPPRPQADHLHAGIRERLDVRHRRHQPDLAGLRQYLAEQLGLLD